MKKLFTILALSVILTACGNSPSSNSAPLPKGNVTLSSKTVQTTPKGARVESESGVDTALFPLMDAGLAKAFADGQASGWADDGVAYNYSRYTIQIPVEPCKPSPESHTPSFLVQAPNYDGSIYDQYNVNGELPKEQQDGWHQYYPDGNGVVYAAELVTKLNTEGSTTNGQPNLNASFVVCPDASVIQNATEYGAEHTITARYDGDYFNLTQTHDKIAHPILPKQNIGNALAARKSQTSAPAKLNAPIIEFVK